MPFFYILLFIGSASGLDDYQVQFLSFRPAWLYWSLLLFRAVCIASAWELSLCRIFMFKFDFAYIFDTYSFSASSSSCGFVYIVLLFLSAPVTHPISLAIMYSLFICPTALLFWFWLHPAYREEFLILSIFIFFWFWVSTWKCLWGVMFDLLTYFTKRFQLTFFDDWK